MNDVALETLTFFEIGINLPILIAQGQAMVHSFGLCSSVYVVAFNRIITAISLNIFSQYKVPFDWVWIGFGMVFWGGLAMSMATPIIARGLGHSGKGYSLFLVYFVGLLTSPIFYPASIVLCKNGISKFEYLMGLGILDFLTRIGMTIYCSLNADDDTAVDKTKKIN